MNTKMMSQFSVMDNEMLARVEGGGCNWGDFAKAGVGGGAARGLQLGIKTGTWQGAATVLREELYLEVWPMQRHVGGNYGF
ncbi:bacteriocin-like peptide N BlpN [Streptococcus pneumoniae]|nr:bacteriocin-like peptide N BlpN [Streptococcus pneumoniae]